MGAVTLVFKKQYVTNTKVDDIAPQIITDCGKLNTGLQATWAMSFSTLPPDSRTLVSKLNTKLALIWKEDFGPLGTVQFFFSLAQVRHLWRQPLAKIPWHGLWCGGSWCLDPSLSPVLVKFTQISWIDFAWQSSWVWRFSWLVENLILIPRLFEPSKCSRNGSARICEQTSDLKPH